MVQNQRHHYLHIDQQKYFPLVRPHFFDLLDLLDLKNWNFQKKKKKGFGDPVVVNVTTMITYMNKMTI